MFFECPSKLPKLILKFIARYFIRSIMIKIYKKDVFDQITKDLAFLDYLICILDVLTKKIS